MGALRDVIKRDGALGFLMRRFDFPMRPSSSASSRGRSPKASCDARSPSASAIPLVLLQSPMSATLLGIALIAAKFGLMRV
jgi:putative tricarboxylic transport membrane protein